MRAVVHGQWLRCRGRGSAGEPWSRTRIALRKKSHEHPIEGSAAQGARNRGRYLPPQPSRRRGASCVVPFSARSSERVWHQWHVTMCPCVCAITRHCSRLINFNCVLHRCVFGHFTWVKGRVHDAMVGPFALLAGAAAAGSVRACVCAHLWQCDL
jgi:hypothetical protein